MNLTLTRDQVLKQLTYLVGKGRILRIKDMVPSGGYEVNPDWIVAQLEQEGGPTKMMFTAKDWELSPIATVPGPLVQHVVLRDHKFYFFVAKGIHWKKDGTGQSSRLHLNSNAMRDNSSKSALGHRVSIKSNTPSHPHSVQAQPAAALSLSLTSKPVQTSPKPGLIILLDAQNTPTHLPTPQSLNPHLNASEILSRLKERAEAGHLEPLDIDVYRWNIERFRKTLRSEEGRSRIGHAFDGRPVRKRSDYPRTLVSSRELAKDGWENTRQREFLVLRRLEEEK